MFEKDLDYFIANQTDLVAKYQSKTLVIKDCKVLEVCDTPLAAFVKATETYEPGTFMIQPCMSGSNAYTVCISTQEIFTNR